MLRDLNKLAKQCQNQYHEEFIPNDIILGDEFKQTFEAFLRSFNQVVEYNETTTVVTTNSNLKILIPNQWFAMAAFMVDFVQEILKYKGHLENILSSEYPSSKARKVFIVQSKEDFDAEKKQQFKDKAVEYFKNYTQEEDPSTCADYIISFLSDYGWWYGSKTIDRGDFYVSPVLNLLGVVNVSQAYIADITYYYATNVTLAKVSTNLKSSSVEDKPVLLVNIDGINAGRKTGAENIIIYGAPEQERVEDLRTDSELNH